MEDCPTCFGKVELFGKMRECPSCEFAQSCKWYGENPDPVDRDGRLTDEHFVSLDARGDWGEVASRQDGGEDEDGYDAPRWSDREMERLLHFLLREVDEYSLGIVIHALRGNAESVAEMGRVFDTSRQGMHRKLLDTCRKYPELAMMLKGVLFRCEKLSRVDEIGVIEGRRDAAKKRAEGNGGGQLEFGF